MPTIPPTTTYRPFNRLSLEAARPPVVEALGIRHEGSTMQNHRVAVVGVDADGQSTGDYFTVEAATRTDAIDEAKMAARDCGWTVDFADYIAPCTQLDREGVL